MRSIVRSTNDAYLLNACRICCDWSVDEHNIG